MSNPLISVMIPTYNREKYIQEAIDSVIAQDYRPLEVIVVDDGSTDRTAGIVKQYDPSIVKYYYQENAGQSAARNACVAHSSGKFLAWLDSDDYYLPGKLTSQLRYLFDNPKSDIVFTFMENFYDNERFKNEIDHEKYKIVPSWQNPEQRACHATMLARRAMIVCAGGWNISFKLHEDVEWLNRIALLHNVDISHCLNEVYYRRRIHEGCISWDSSHESLSVQDRIRIRYLRKIIAEDIR